MIFRNRAYIASLLGAPPGADSRRSRTVRARAASPAAVESLEDRVMLSWDGPFGPILVPPTDTPSGSEGFIIDNTHPHGEAVDSAIQRDFHGDDLVGGDGPTAQIGFKLTTLYHEYQYHLVTREQPSDPFEPTSWIADLVIADDRVQLDVWVATRDFNEHVLASDWEYAVGVLNDLDFTFEDGSDTLEARTKFSQKISGWLPITNLRELALGEIHTYSPTEGIRARSTFSVGYLNSGLGGSVSGDDSLAITGLKSPTPSHVDWLDSTPLFAWNPAPGAHHYDLWVNAGLGGGTIAFREQNVTDTSFEAPVVLSDGIYNWDVRAIDADGNAGPWFGNQKLTLDASLEMIGARAPASGTNTSDSSLTFTWPEVPGADHYDIWVNVGLGGGTMAFRNQQVEGTSYVHPGTLADGWYNWDVRAITDDGAVTVWHGNQTFKVETARTNVPPSVERNVLFPNVPFPDVPFPFAPVLHPPTPSPFAQTLKPPTGLPSANELLNAHIIIPAPTELDILVARDFHGTDGHGKDGPLAALGPDLIRLYHEFQIHQKSGTTEAFRSSKTRLAHSGSRVRVEIYRMAKKDTELDAALRELGWQVSATLGRGQSGTLPIDSLPDLLKYAGIRHVEPVWIPIFYSGVTTTQGDVDSHGDAGAWFGNQKVTIDNSLDMLGTRGPASGDTTLDSTLTFTWPEVPGADHYDIWVNVGLGGGTTAFRNQNVDGTSYVHSSALPDGWYNWDVHAITNNGVAMAWHGNQTFKVDTSATIPTPPTPSGNSSTPPTFTWDHITGAAYYELWVNKVGGPSGIIHVYTPSAGFTDHIALPVGSYQWDVRGFTDDDVAGDWVGTQTFSITGIFEGPSLESTPPDDPADEQDKLLEETSPTEPRLRQEEILIAAVDKQTMAGRAGEPGAVSADDLDSARDLVLAQWAAEEWWN